ncbi:hypothetical protein [Phenylobacterium sp.]|uniref:hypothetical protein n=1 Tax=Phenylobacterium sp. TaxID=1871053 RepID=UPI0025F55519|nr:hypothetical protein [Phenylobacterium sp.]
MPEGWEGFFVAEAGAAAALAGLLFVAVSINLGRILEFPNLPLRAIEALTAFVSILAVATIGLTPHQSALAYGVEIAAAGAVAWLIQTIALVRGKGPGGARTALRVLLNQLPALPFVAAGGLVCAGYPGGLAWLLPGVLLSFCAGIVGAWVLLVEIQR